VLLAPGAFELDSEEIAVVVDLSPATDEALKRAASRCPAGAIFINPHASPAQQLGGN
jgi:ferredoxin